MDAMRDGRDASPGVDPGGKAFPVAELLAHTGWMRALARTLVRDEALAEDLVQESLLRAVERPPRQPGALGSWLRTVLSRAASRSREEERSRARRELRVARPERSDSTPAEVLERVEIQGEVVNLVLALEEPYRSAVLLSYFEDWSAEEIARRQGVAANTVRWRLRKAIELLRERLDRRHGGRAAWCAALVPLLWTGRGAEAGLAGLAAAESAAPSLMAACWVLPGIAIMKTKTAAIAAVLSILLLLGFFLHLTRDRAAAPEIPAAPIAAAVPSAAPAPAPPVASGPPRPA